MKLNIKEYLTDFIQTNPDIGQPELIQVPDAMIETNDIRLIMISEVVPQNPDDYFYSKNTGAAFMTTTVPILNAAGANVNGIEDIIRKGIYITTAVKTPKDGYTIPTQVIREQLPVLEKELDLFDNTKVIMLMGDVAKKAFNMITKKKAGKNLIPAQSTYRIRGNKYYYGGIRVFPSYIITGGNLLIEKSKVNMIEEDISAAFLESGIAVYK